MLLSRFKFVFVSIMVASLIFCVSKASIAGSSNEPATVVVQVTAMGSPVENAEVNIDNQSDTTGQNGNRTFHVTKGYHTVTVTDANGNSDSREVRVNPGEIVQVTIDLGSAGRPASIGNRHELTFSKN